MIEQLSFFESEEIAEEETPERSEEEQKEFEEWREKKKEAKARFTAMQNLPYEVKVRRAEQRAIEFIEQMDAR